MLNGADEISETEANLFAVAYADRYLNHCSPQKPKLQGDIWEFPVTSGRAATASGVIRIDRKIGTVSYEGPLGSKPATTAFAGSTGRGPGGC